MAREERETNGRRIGWERMAERRRGLVWIDRAESRQRDGSQWFGKTTACHEGHGGSKQA